MVEMKAEVVEHYGQGDLKERLSRALYAAGLSSQVLSPMVLAPLDQFHVRGNRCNEGTRGSGAPILGIQIAMGPDFPHMSANLSRNLRERRIGLIQAVLEKP